MCILLCVYISRYVCDVHHKRTCLYSYIIINCIVTTIIMLCSDQVRIGILVYFILFVMVFSHVEDYVPFENNNKNLPDFRLF